MKTLWLDKTLCGNPELYVQQMTMVNSILPVLVAKTIPKMYNIKKMKVVYLVLSEKIKWREVVGATFRFDGHVDKDGAANDHDEEAKTKH